MKKFKFKILKKDWTLRLLSKTEYMKINGDIAAGITDTNTRMIDLSPVGKDLETIVHELVHAYMGEMCHYNCDLDEDNLEEVYAELMAKRGKELLRLADSLWLRISEKNGGSKRR